MKKMFVNVNRQSTLLLGSSTRRSNQVRLWLEKLEVAEYTALQTKQSVVGNGAWPKKIKGQEMWNAI